MTWLKLSDDYADELARFDLSDAAFRTHTEALLWVMRRETGGHLAERDVARFADSAQADSAVNELCAHGLWERAGPDYIVRFHMEHQPDPEVLAARRASTAKRVQKHRRKQAGLATEPPGNAVTERVTPPVTERVTRDGSGRAGTGTPTPHLQEQPHAPDNDIWSTPQPRHSETA